MKSVLEPMPSVNYAKDTARKQLISQVLSATTLEEIHQARQALRQWKQAHPDDLGIGDGFEQLYIMEDAVRIIAAEEQEARDRKQAA